MSAFFKYSLSTIFAASMLSSGVFAQNFPTCTSDDWVTKDDSSFASDCAEMAFTGDPGDRQMLAWMFFTRTNQLVADTQSVSETGRIPVWMTWATDTDTFKINPDFKFTLMNRDDLSPVTGKKVLAGQNRDAESPDSSLEEVTRNYIGYEYIISANGEGKQGLNTKQGVIDYLVSGNDVQMPVGSVEIKASWHRYTDESEVPEGALTFKFASGKYWWRGMHIMVKMDAAPAGTDLFYSEKPSWFWTTFEFNGEGGDPGIRHVRDSFITQRAPLGKDIINRILSFGGIDGLGFAENYWPNGTQIRFTENAEGNPVVLGHTIMEGFAGMPSTSKNPQEWSSFEASCHTCHAIASINPTTGEFFPFPGPNMAGANVPEYPVGAITEDYVFENSKGEKYSLTNGYRPLDFMWPITFHAK